ncbi:MAG: YebG family protein [Desulfosarcina sp.]|nr:YebG family protein [Desulfosarcina sp.]MBC2743302.1 YebG family protein [Desulfosarcina sp.]MBC2766212.1 YebG family protein [Desulfosarcina sp.]
MAVITKYVVVRNGVELDREFLVKKEAEAYDKMLDAAENLAAYIKNAGLEINLDDKTINAISVFLAKNGPEVSRVLKGLKPNVPPARTPGEEKKDESPVATAKKKTPAAKAKPKSK